MQYTNHKLYLISTFVTLPKKYKSTECTEYRTTSLRSQVLKIFLERIHARIHSKCSMGSNNQFAFRCGLGTFDLFWNILRRLCDAQSNQSTNPISIMCIFSFLFSFYQNFLGRPCFLLLCEFMAIFFIHFYYISVTFYL